MSDAAVAVVDGLLISNGGVSGSLFDQGLSEAEQVGVSIDAAAAAADEVEEDDVVVVVSIGGRGRVYCWV